MSAGKTREQLIELELESQESKELLQLTLLQLANLQAEIDTAQEEAAQRGQQLRALRKQLIRDEALEASAEQSAGVKAAQAELRGKFTALASGHIWYEGTGNDDAILEHQWIGMMFGAVAKRWVLGDGPGLGKTRQAIGWLDLVEAKRVVVVCQADVTDQFAAETMVLAPHRTITNLYKKTPDARHEMLDAAVANTEGVVFLNFEIWRKDKKVLEKIFEWQADTIIIDEAHNIKSTSTSNYKNVKALISTDNTCGGCGAYKDGLRDKDKLPRYVATACEHCGWKKGDPAEGNRLEQLIESRSVKNVCMTTGTPILNSPDDLFPLLHLCDPVLFPSRKNFVEAFCMSNYHSGKLEFRTGALDHLKPLIEGRFIARTYDDAGIVLPPQNIHFVRVELDKNEYPLQYRTIRQITDQAQIILDNGNAMTLMHLFSILTRKRQANVWPGGISLKDPTTGEVMFSVGDEVQESVKVDAVLRNVWDFHQEGHRQIVFTKFKTVLPILEERLKAAGIRAVRLDGDTPTALRTKIKNNFYLARGEEPLYDVVLAHYSVGGTGLNLTAATKTHIIDEEWNPGKRDQAYGRNHRIGTVDDTQVYVYRIPQSVDTWMANTISRKQNIIDGFEGKMKESDENDLYTSLKEAIMSGEIL